MTGVSHVGQYWCARRREVRLLAATDVSCTAAGELRGKAYDVADVFPVPPSCRSRFRREERGRDWAEVRWTYSALPFPVVELVEWLEGRGRSVRDWARELGAHLADGGDLLDLTALDRDPSPEVSHLVAPVIPRRAQAFGVTYLNSALERNAEGRRSDYGYVYRSVKEREERPEVFIKATSPEHVVGPRGNMALRRDLTNSETMEGESVAREVVGAGIEPELAVVVYSSGEIWGYTLADDVSGNKLENETLLYLYQAKLFTGSLVLGPLILLATEQRNPDLDITCRVTSPGGEVLFERTTNTGRINAPLRSLIAWAASHIDLVPAEVFSTGTDMVPEGRAKVLEEGALVEISCPTIGPLLHRAAALRPGVEINLDYSRLEFEA